MALALAGCASKSSPPASPTPAPPTNAPAPVVSSPLPPSPPGIKLKVAKATYKPGSKNGQPQAIRLEATDSPTAVTLSWQYADTNQIAGFNVYDSTTSGTNNGTYENVTTVPGASATEATISNLTAGVTYYFAATAFETNGLESTYSDEVSYTIPQPATNVLITITLLTSSNLSGPWAPSVSIPPIDITNPPEPFTYWMLSITATNF